MNPARIFVLAGPSGVGKNTVLKTVLANHPDFYRPVNLTSRPPRPGEVEGEDYFFNTDRRKFAAKSASGELLESNEFAGELYGTLRSQLEEPLQAGRTVCTLVDVNGALKIKEAFPALTTLIFIGPPNARALKSRLQNRHTETEEQLQERLKLVDYEMDIGAKHFDYQVINPDNHPELAVVAIEEIINQDDNSN